MKPILLCATLLLLSWAHLAAAPQDKLELVSGEMLYGKILRANDVEVSIQLTSGGILSFRRSQVKAFRASHLLPARPYELPPLVDEPPVPHPWDPAGGGERPIIVDREGKPAGAQPAGGLPPASRFGRIITGGPGERAGDGSDPSSPGDRGSESLSQFTSRRHQFSVRIPDGFTAVEAAPQGAELESADQRSWKDAASGATVSVKFLSGEESIIDAKKSFVRELIQRIGDLQLEQDAALYEEDYEAWIVEVRGRDDRTPVRHIAFFALAPAGVVRLEAAFPESERKRLDTPLRDFRKSLRLLARPPRAEPFSQPLPGGRAKGR